MKLTYAIISLSLLLLTGNNALADHILGGELLYTYIGNNNYKIVLTIEGECSGGAFNHLKNAHPIITVLNKEGALNTLTLNEDISKRAEITNVCPAEAANTTCKNPQGNIPGVTQFQYSGIIKLAPSATWQIIFGGQMDKSGISQTGLSNLISNIKLDPTYGFHMHLEATLNNLYAHNSSPQYTYTASPFYCINTAQEYNQGAIDPDNDELRFKLMPPFALNGTVTQYISPYSPVHPFATIPETFFYNSTTGQMSFTPAKTEVALVVNEVEEYRNETLVGSSMRVMSFFIQNNCNNQPPFGNIDPSTITGGMLHNNTINVCDGEHRVTFKIPVTDNNNENVNVELTNIPSGANAIITGNNTQKPVIEFSWDMTNIAPGNYTFFASYNDGACPRPGNQVMAYTVNVAAPFSIFHEVMGPTNCIKKQVVRFHTDGGILPRKLIVQNSAGTGIANYSDYTGSIDDSFKKGNYKVLMYADYLPCSTTYTFEVDDYGTYPLPPIFDDIHHCLNEQAELLNPSPAVGGKVQWFDMQKTPLNETPTYKTDSVRNYKWLVNQKVLTCESVYDTFDVSIHSFPDIQILNDGGHACVGDGMYLEAKGGVRYEWEPRDKIVYYDSLPYTYIYEPVTYTVTGYSEYNCSTSDTLVFNNIEQCCLFSYPNGFTPNADGSNDGWHPITYGNVDFYLLSIYNRWGQRVFTTSKPKEKWDGRFGGQLCPMGSYHYYLRAKCITGHEEKARGSFILLR